MKFCFDLNRQFQSRCFTPDALRRLAPLVDWKPDAPENAYGWAIRSCANWNAF